MKILHTSDWHIGSTCYGKKRYEEYSEFFQWVLQTINEEQAEVLLVAGDIFDTALPSNTAQQLYYSFLISLQKTSCQHVVITGGNHDSPSFLNAPKQLLKTLNIHVVGAASESLQDELIIIEQNNEQVIILAVPYLRERDLQGIAITDNFENRAKKICEGIQNHYQKLTELALQRKKNNGKIIAMGHLFLTGATQTDEEERELYIGSLAQITTAAFPNELDYVALGHIHSAQKISGTNHIRYCGSPLAMNFSEKKHSKKILLLNTEPNLSVKEITVPEFQTVRKIKGNFSQIQTEIEKLKKLNQSVWLEIEYTGEEDGNLKNNLFQLTENSTIEILKFKNLAVYSNYFNPENTQDNLEELSPTEVFDSILKNSTYTEKNQKEMREIYLEILAQIHEKDNNE